MAENKKPFEDYGDGFCILPWIHMATYTDGTALLCCLAQPPRHDSRLNFNRATIDAIWNSNYWRQARTDMLAGKKLPACRHCWKEEASGISSHRINENYMWTKTLGEDFLTDIISKTQEDGTLDHEVITLDLRLGNTCNVKCVMCRPVDSSKWVNDAKIIAEQSTDPEIKSEWEWKVNDHANGEFDWAKDDEFWDREVAPLLPNMRHFIFAGGEPLYLKNHKRFLKKCVESGYAGNIQLRYHTNGTLMPDDVLELWSHFKYVELMVSIDSIGDKNHWLRYPTDWDTVKKTLDKIEAAPDNIIGKVLSTIHALNIYYIPEFCEWLLEQNYKKIAAHHDGLFHPGILHYPQYMSAKVLPAKTKEAVTAKLTVFIEKYSENRTAQEFRQLLEFMNSEDHSDKNKTLHTYVRHIDRLNGTDFPSVFTEFYQIWER